MNSFQIRSLDTNEAILNLVHSFLAEYQSNSPTIVSKSSGSTGKPKEIELQKTYLKASARMTGSFFNFKAGEKIVLALPLTSIGGKMLVVRAIEHQLILLINAISRNPLKNLNEYIDFVALTPMQAQIVLDETPEKFSLVKNCLLGGSKVSAQLEKRLLPFSCHFFESFGMTETISHIAIRQLNSENQAFFSTLEGVSVSVNKQGCLCIQAPHLGIENLETNDLVELNSKNQFRFLGRTDFVINSGGLKFHPELIEQKIQDLIPFPFFLIGEKDPLLGEKMVLFIEKNVAQADENLLLTKIKSHLDRYEFPKNTYFVPSFVYTQSGKINRIETQNKYKAKQ